MEVEEENHVITTQPRNKPSLTSARIQLCGCGENMSRYGCKGKGSGSMSGVYLWLIQ